MKNKIQNHFQSNYEAFYGKYLQGIKKIGGNEYRALCPLHEDKNPSFNFNNQTGAYYCHGCNKKGGIFHFYAKINSLDTKRDFSKILKGIASDFGIPWEEKKSRIVKTYDYTDAEGDLLFQVCRMDPKDFRQRRPDGKDGWIWNLKGIDPVLYRLQEVLKAKEIIIVEGERDTDTVVELGFDATTCAMGAKKWRDTYNEALKGKDVVLIPDNDNEGREHMTKIAISLNGTAKTLKWIELPDLKSKGDISDWVTRFEDKNEAAESLSLMIDRADLYEPPKKASFEDAILETQAFNTIDLPPKRQIIDPWLSEQSISLIAGWRGTGKTWFAMSLLDAITRGEPFGPWNMGVCVPCLYLEGEMPAQDVKERLKDLNPNQERKQPFYVYSDAYANTLGLPRANLIAETWRTTMKRILTTRGVKLWVVDNLASLTGGIDENAKRDWDPVNAWLLELRFAGIATMLLHHTNKGGSQRGTSAREDNIDTSIMLKRPFDYVPEDGAKFILNFQKARVATKDLGLIGDTQFQLTQNEIGQLTWTWGNVRRETKVEALRLIDEGATNQEIIEALGVTKGRVSQIRKSAINEGMLSMKGKLTQSGFTEVYGE